MMLSAILFAVMGLLVILASSRFSFLALQQHAPGVRLLGAMLIAAVLIHTQVFVLGVVGQLSPYAVLACSAVTAVAAYGWRRSSTPSAQPIGMPHLWMLALGGALAGGIVFRAVWLRQSYTPDDLSLNALLPALWVQAQGFGASLPDALACAPLAPHTLTAWLLLPFHNDGLAALGGLYWMALAVVAAYVVARNAGAERAAALLSALCLPLATEAMRDTLSFSGADIAGMACILGALGLLGAGGPLAAPAAFIAGASGGIALGGNAALAPVLLTLLVAVAVRKGRLRNVPAFALGAGLTGGLWYLRHFLKTGHLVPASPVPLPAIENVHRASVWTWLTQPPDGAPHLMQMAWDHLNWPYPLGVAALLGLVAAPVVLGILHRRGESGVTARLLLLAAFAGLAAYPFAEITVMSGAQKAPVFADLRALLVPYACGVILLAVAGTAGIAWRQATLALLAAALFVGTGKTFLDLGAEYNSGELAAMAGAGIAVALGLVLGQPRVRALARPAVMLVLAALLLFRLGTFSESRRDINSLVIGYYGGPFQPIGKAWKIIGEMAEPQRVACFASGGHMAYPLLGRDYQHRYIPVDENGRTDASAPAGELVENLRASGVSLVLVSRWDNRLWPAQYEALERDTRARKTYDDGYSAVYEIPPAS